jgi:hypothetical protein
VTPRDIRKSWNGDVDRSRHCRCSSRAVRMPRPHSTVLRNSNRRPNSFADEDAGEHVRQADDAAEQ